MTGAAVPDAFSVESTETTETLLIETVGPLISPAKTIDRAAINNVVPVAETTLFVAMSWELLTESQSAPLPRMGLMNPPATTQDVPIAVRFELVALMTTPEAVATVGALA